jgi:hypothetical protein
LFSKRRELRQAQMPDRGTGTSSELTVMFDLVTAPERKICGGMGVVAASSERLRAVVRRTHT